MDILSIGERSEAVNCERSEQEGEVIYGPHLMVSSAWITFIISAYVTVWIIWFAFKSDDTNRYCGFQRLAANDGTNGNQALATNDGTNGNQTLTTQKLASSLGYPDNS